MFIVLNKSGIKERKCSIRIKIENPATLIKNIYGFFCITDRQTGKESCTLEMGIFTKKISNLSTMVGEKIKKSNLLVLLFMNTNDIILFSQESYF